MEKDQMKATCSEMLEWSSSDDEEYLLANSEGDEEIIGTSGKTDEMPCMEHDKSEAASQIPIVGMTFISDDAAYKFYNDYARVMGFSIKKSHLERRKDGSLKQRTYCCSKQGMREVDRRRTAKKPHPETRTNCMARLEFKVDKNELYTLSKVELNHNHPMTSPNKVHMLRSHRKILSFQRALIDQMTESGMKAHNIYNYFESGVSNNNVGFIREDNSNYIQRSRRKALDGKESKGILRYLKERLANDPSFFYAIEACEESGEMKNFFWVDGQSIIDYAYFGDVVCFDTTFQTNEYNIPFAPIVGVNHHKQTIILGAALLYDESAKSFIWLFETFLEAMHGKHPVTIFTDQSAAIARAIQTVLPNTAHRLCLWHIFQNAALHLSHVIHNNNTFAKDFKHCIYERCTVDTFEKLWQDLLLKYNLVEHPWMVNMWKLRSKWAACFRTETFSADMTTTQRSESMNHHFKRFFRKKLSLFEFLEQYDKALSFFREKEIKADFKSRNSTPANVVGNMCKQAASIYTRVMYNEFEACYQSSLDCLMFFIGAVPQSISYKLTNAACGRDEMVIFSQSPVQVSC